jgi:hypothetical protein
VKAEDKPQHELSQYNRRCAAGMRRTRQRRREALQQADVADDGYYYLEHYSLLH